MKNFLTAQEVVILREAHYDSRFRKRADRIKAILFLNQGFSFEQTAKLLMLDEGTIRRYLKEFKQGGVDLLVEDNYSGSESFLTTVEQQQLTLYLKATTYHTVKQVVVFVEGKYGKKYSIEGMTHLLHKLGFVYKKIEDHQPEGEIYLILDNARYNHAKKVKSYVKRSDRVHLVFLPSYSPNLNIIERLWLFLHQKILYDHYYETFPEFKTAVINFFQNIDIYKKELKTRLTDSFQIIPA